MDRLVDDHAAAFVRPGSAPWTAAIVFVGAIPDRAGAHPEQSSQLAAIDDRLEFARQRLESHLEDDAERDVGAFTRADHRIAFRKADRHCFFDDDMFARGGGINRHRRVQVVRCANRNSIDIVAREEVTVIRLPRSTMLRDKCAPVFWIARRDGDQLRVGSVLDRRRVYRRNVTDADDAKT